MPKAYYQAKNRILLIIKVVGESIAKTWSNLLGLGIIAATTYFDKTAPLKTLPLKTVFLNFSLTLSVTGNHYD